jgi:hypothetical protein
VGGVTLMQKDNKQIIYKEVIPFGKSYKLAMQIVIIMLALLTVIFIYYKLPEGFISSGLTLIFIILIAKTIREVNLYVTDRELVWKWGFLKFKVPISDIITVEIKDVDSIPEIYRGHIKIYWGLINLNELKGFKLRKGDAVHINTKKGHTIILTPKNNQMLADILKKLKKEGI